MRAMIVILAGLFLTACAEAPATVAPPADDARSASSTGDILRLNTIGGVAERRWSATIRYGGATYRCEAARWGFDTFHTHRAEVRFCRSTRLSTWNGNDREIASDDFFEFFHETRRADSKTRATAGLTVESVLGTLRTHAFDVDDSTFGDTYRQCLGFIAPWEADFEGVDGLYGKALAFYACGKWDRPISEKRLAAILSGLSVQDEFEALTE